MAGLPKMLAGLPDLWAQVAPPTYLALLGTVEPCSKITYLRKWVVNYPRHFRFVMVEMYTIAVCLILVFRS